MFHYVHPGVNQLHLLVKSAGPFLPEPLTTEVVPGGVPGQGAGARRANRPSFQ